jgi:hypothetical protein
MDVEAYAVHLGLRSRMKIASIVDQQLEEVDRSEIEAIRSITIPRGAFAPANRDRIVLFRFLTDLLNSTRQLLLDSRSGMVPAGSSAIVSLIKSRSDEARLLLLKGEFGATEAQTRGFAIEPFPVASSPSDALLRWVDSVTMPPAAQLVRGGKKGERADGDELRRSHWNALPLPDAQATDKLISAMARDFFPGEFTGGLSTNDEDLDLIPVERDESVPGYPRLVSRDVHPPAEQPDARNNSRESLSLTPAVQKAARSYFEYKEKLAQANPPLWKVYEWLKKNGCAAYEGENWPKQKTWERYLRRYFKASGTGKNVSRRGRGGRSIVGPDDV